MPSNSNEDAINKAIPSKFWRKSYSSLKFLSHPTT
jgi:hypothetical protein